METTPTDKPTTLLGFPIVCVDGFPEDVSGEVVFDTPARFIPGDGDNLKPKGENHK